MSLSDFPSAAELQSYVRHLEQRLRRVEQVVGRVLSGGCRTMTNDERSARGVPKGCEAYLVTLPSEADGLHEDVLLLRDYQINTDTYTCRAFSPQQWKEATEPPVREE